MVRRFLACSVILITGGLLMLRLDRSPDGEALAQDKKTPFAADRGAKAPETKAVPFDGKRAMTYLEAICAIGPRMSGTDGMKSQQDLIRNHFTKLDYKVEEQKFAGKQVSRPVPINMTNLVISFFPEKKNRVLISSHYDTRPLADQEPNKNNWKKPFVSANDGGSGVAFLMELANHMKGLKTNVGVDFVFFDGEEYIFDKERDRYFLGSEAFARNYLNNKGDKTYSAGVLLDMIGGKDAQFPLEVNSYRGARAVCIDLWTIAKELNVKNFQQHMGQEVLDDHLALIEAGIPTVDIIDFDYPHWHKLTDTPANCSGDSLEQVSKVLSTWLQRVK